MAKKISEQELSTLKKLNEEFNKVKTQLGDLSLQKHGLCLQVERIKGEFQTIENDLTAKYGKDAVINMDTGEVKKKEEAKETEEIKK
jgi:hypothetical protein